MKTLKNNKGITLVEIIVGVAIFAIASIALVQGFVSSANIINLATLYKNASAAASSSVELQEEQDSVDSSVEIDLSSQSKAITIKGKKANGAAVSVTVNGDIYYGIDNGKSEINYREFVPGAYDILEVE